MSGGMDSPAADGRLARVLAWPVRHPAITLVTIGVCTVLSIVGVSRLRFSPALQDMFATDDPASLSRLA